MTDTPTKKKRFGSGVCWDYMEKGRCNCDVSAYPPRSHPKLSVESYTNAETEITSTIVCIPEHIPEWVESLNHLGFVKGDASNFATLNTTYEEREEAKALGATFSPGMKKWIVVKGQDIEPFAKWKPRINNRKPNEVVMFHSIDMVSTVRELQRRGLHASHFDIQGDDDKAENLRKELSSSAMQQKGIHAVESQTGVINLCTGISVNERKRLDEQHSTSVGEDKTHASASKRPRFSDPESLHSFVRKKQDEQAGDISGQDVHGEQLEVITEQSEISTLLSTAKSALVRCNSSGGISSEQKQFNEAMYNLMEALTAKHGMQDKADTESRSNVCTTSSKSPAHASQRQKVVTPTQKTGVDGKVPGVPGTWYDTT